MTQTCLLDRSSVRSQRSAWVAVNCRRIIALSAIAEPRPAVCIVFARFPELDEPLRRELRWDLCADLVATAARPEQEEGAGEAEDQRDARDHAIEPFPSMPGELEAPPPRLPA